MTADAADRAKFIAGLRALAGFLAAHPDAPLPEGYHETAIFVFPDGQSDDERRAGVDAAAAVIGATAGDPHGCGHYMASRAFGPVVYEVLAISDASRAEARARDSYYDAVTLDDGPAVAGAAELGEVAA
jgi:hypothetical protein